MLAGGHFRALLPKLTVKSKEKGDGKTLYLGTKSSLGKISVTTLGGNQKWGGGHLV